MYFLFFVGRFRNVNPTKTVMKASAAEGKDADHIVSRYPEENLVVLKPAS